MAKIHIDYSRNYYADLGVSKAADMATIKKAYRALAKSYHPDGKSGDKLNEDAIKRINDAWEVLSDEEAKADYDRNCSTREAASEGFEQGDPADWQRGSWRSTVGGRQNPHAAASKRSGRCEFAAQYFNMDLPNLGKSDPAELDPDIADYEDLIGRRAYSQANHFARTRDAYLEEWVLHNHEKWTSRHKTFLPDEPSQYDEQLMNAVIDLNISKVYELLDLGANPNTPIKTDRLRGAATTLTPLQVACYAMLEFVFVGHAGVNHKNLALVKALCAESKIKIKPDVMPSGNSALHMVCCHTEYDLEQFLVYNPYRVEIVLGLLDMGASVDLKDNFAGKNGEATPLMYACSHGWIGCIKALMRNGANHEAKDFGGTDVRAYAMNYVQGRDYGNMRVLNTFEAETRAKAVPYERLGCTPKALADSFMIGGHNSEVSRLR